jgi:hypothetical protein
MNAAAATAIPTNSTCSLFTIGLMIAFGRAFDPAQAHAIASGMALALLAGPSGGLFSRVEPKPS